MFLFRNSSSKTDKTSEAVNTAVPGKSKWTKMSTQLGLHYAIRYSTELGVNSSQPCHIVTCQCIQHNTNHVLDNCPIHTGAVCDSVPIAC